VDAGRGNSSSSSSGSSQQQQGLCGFIRAAEAWGSSSRGCSSGQQREAAVAVLAAVFRALSVLPTWGAVGGGGCCQSSGFILYLLSGDVFTWHCDKVMPSPSHRCNSC
jgi:hypothetical protein